MKCDRCGKEIKDNDYRYTVSVPDLDNEVEVSVWCKECHDDFVDSLKTPTKAFKDIKPAVPTELSLEDKKKWAKIFDGTKVKE